MEVSVIQELIEHKQAYEIVYNDRKKELENKINDKIEEHNKIVINFAKKEFSYYLDGEKINIVKENAEVEKDIKIILDDIKTIKQEIIKLDKLAIDTYGISNITD